MVINSDADGWNYEIKIQLKCNQIEWLLEYFFPCHIYHMTSTLPLTPLWNTHLSSLWCPWPLFHSIWWLWYLFFFPVRFVIMASQFVMISLSSYLYHCFCVCFLCLFHETVPPWFPQVQFLSWFHNYFTCSHDYFLRDFFFNPIFHGYSFWHFFP